MKRLLASIAVLMILVNGCVHQREGAVLVLKYEDFGPQAAVYELIGFQWFQWNNHGSSNPAETDPVYVVVYDGVSLREIKRRFPVVEAKNQDYRYLPLNEAVELVEKVDEAMQTLTEDERGNYILHATRNKLKAHFR